MERDSGDESSDSALDDRCGGSGEEDARPGAHRWISPGAERIVCAVAFTAVVVWVVVGTWAAFRGLDMFDEAWYLITYRDARASDPLVTAAPFIIRPVYDLLGGSVVALRIVKLGAWLLLGTFMGVSFARWINVTPGLRRVNPLTLGAVFATSGMTLYAVYPQTPSYNDLSIAFTFGLLALAFRLAATGPERRIVGAYGATGAAMAVLLGATKATTGVVAVVVALAVLGAASSGELQWYRCWRSFVAGSLGGAAVTVAFVHVFIVDLVTFAEATAWAVDVVQRSTVPWDKVWDREEMTLRWHRHALRDDFGAVAIVMALAIPLYLVRWRALARVCLSVGLVLFVVVVIARHYYRGGYVHLGTQSIAMSALVIGSLALGSGLLVRPGSVPRRVVVVLGALAVLPYAQALGSNVPYMWLAVSASAVWLLLCTIVCCAQQSDDRRTVAFAATALVWCLGITVAWTGLLTSPTRVWTPLTGQTEAATGFGLEGLLVDPATARHMAELADLGRAHRDGPDRPMLIGLTDLPGAVVAMDAETLAGGWFFDASPDRTVAVVERVCASTSWRDRRADPLILVRDFELTDTLIDLLQRCGVDFPVGYQPVGTSDQPMGYYPFDPRVTLWAPIEADPTDSG